MKKSYKILIVDDEPNVIQAIVRSLDDQDYELFTTTDPQKAMQLIQDNNMDLILSDQRMPNMQGIELLMYARKISPDTVRVLMTGYTDLDVIISAINDGRIYYYLPKPWDNEELIQTVKSALFHKQKECDKESVLNMLLTNKQRLDVKVNELKDVLSENRKNIINALLTIMSIRDNELYNHSQKICQHALDIANLLSLSEEQKENIRVSVMFRDFGKIVLSEHSSRISDDNSQEMQMHPLVTAEIMRNFGFSEDVCSIIAQHHEHINGTGYPLGLKDSEIHIEARIIAIADIYCALSRHGSILTDGNQNTIFYILTSESGKRFDSVIVNTFIKSLKAKRAVLTEIAML